MSSLFKSTLNTRALPIGGLRYIRSDAPLLLSEEEIQWLLSNNITTLVDLRSFEELVRKPCPLKEIEGFTYYHLPVMGVVSALLLKKLGAKEDIIVEDYMMSKENLIDMLTAYVQEYPEVDIEIIIPYEENILKVIGLVECA